MPKKREKIDNILIAYMVIFLLPFTILQDVLHMGHTYGEASFSNKWK